jgi:hypothetical protein
MTLNFSLCLIPSLNPPSDFLFMFCYLFVGKAASMVVVVVVVVVVVLLLMMVMMVFACVRNLRFSTRQGILQHMFQHEARHIGVIGCGLGIFKKALLLLYLAFLSFLVSCLGS